jgi:hypothetical protein
MLFHQVIQMPCLDLQRIGIKADRLLAGKMPL